MASRPAVYTAIYGNFDRLIEPVPQDIDVDWYCFTDQGSLTSEAWRVILDPPRYDQPRLSAKWPKMMPDEVLPDHKWSIWVDANLAIDSPGFVREALSYAQKGLALFRHPLRNSICHEAYACLRRADCGAMPVLDQVRHYGKEGYGDTGLYACGVLVRDQNAWSASGIGEMWLEECVRWSPRDQLSFPVLLAKLGMSPSLFPFHIGRASWWLTIARYFGLTPGSFPKHLLVDPEARRLCSPIWFPPVRTFPLQWSRPTKSFARPIWLSNPWFDVRPHVG